MLVVSCAYDFVCLWSSFRRVFEFSMRVLLVRRAHAFADVFKHVFEIFNACGPRSGVGVVPEAAAVVAHVFVDWAARREWDDMFDGSNVIEQWRGRQVRVDQG